MKPPGPLKNSKANVSMLDEYVQSTNCVAKESIKLEVNQEGIVGRSQTPPDKLRLQVSFLFCGAGERNSLKSPNISDTNKYKIAGNSSIDYEIVRTPNLKTVARRLQIAIRLLVLFVFLKSPKTTLLLILL